MSGFGGYIVVYLEILFLSFVIAAVLYAKTSRDLGSEREVRAFRVMLFIYMVMMAIDSFTQLQYRGFIHPPVITAALASGAYAALLAVMAMCWMVFAELQINPQLTRNHRFRFLAALPGLVSVCMCMTSPWTGLVFFYDSTGVFQRGSLFAFQNLVAYFYFLFTTIHALYTASKERSYARKRQLQRLATIIIAPSVGALLQLLFAGFPFMGPSICIAFLIIFVSVQGDMIHSDSLTGLNNRKSLERYFTNILPLVSSENPLYIFMIDANHFKQINDTYGHVEGDRALIMIARALRAFANIHHGFIARYGGDEFVAVVSKDMLQDPGILDTFVNEKLEKECKQEHTPYTVTVSAGYTVCDDPSGKIDHLLKNADEMMYRAKIKNNNPDVLEQW